MDCLFIPLSRRSCVCCVRESAMDSFSLLFSSSLLLLILAAAAADVSVDSRDERSALQRRGEGGAAATPGGLRFSGGKRGEFKILQVADMHYADGRSTGCLDVFPNQTATCSDLNTTAFVYRVIRAERPDLVVFTGTIIQPNIFPFFSFSYFGFCFDRLSLLVLSV